MDSKVLPDKLLIVDDEIEIAETIYELAGIWSIPALKANSAQEAFEIFKKGEVVAVISDISMPEKTGIDLLKEIRATGSEVPFMFLTAHDTKTHMLKAIQYGATNFIEKPFVTEDLQESLYKLMEIGNRIASNNDNKKMLNLLKINIAKKKGA